MANGRVSLCTCGISTALQHCTILLQLKKSLVDLTESSKKKEKIITFLAEMFCKLSQMKWEQVV